MAPLCDGELVARGTHALLRMHRHIERIQAVLEKASERFPQFAEHARFLSAQGGISRFGGLVRNFFLSSAKQASERSQSLFVNITDDSQLSREEFASVLKTIDLGLRGLPATAQVRPIALCQPHLAWSAGLVHYRGLDFRQAHVCSCCMPCCYLCRLPAWPCKCAMVGEPGAVTELACIAQRAWTVKSAKRDTAGLRLSFLSVQVARQQGEWLAREVFAKHQLTDGAALPEDAPDFVYKHKGALAYVGRDRAVMDVPVVGPLWGVGAGIVWKGFETYSQFSWRNKALVSIDWLRTKVFGRDISRV
jgi:hypothetical protein